MRILVYTLVWLGCNLAIAGCVAALAVLAVFYTTIGPFACLYAGALVGDLCGLNIYATATLMMVGLWLFRWVRARLYRHVRRGWRHGLRLLRRCAALRDDLWRQYRLAAQPHAKD